jgi:hypothetical protein
LKTGNVVGHVLDQVVVAVTTVAVF